MVPLKEHIARVINQDSIVVSLKRPQVPASEAARPVQTEPLPLPRPESVESVPESLTEPPVQQQLEPPPPAAPALPETRPPDRVISTARLLDSADSRQWQLQEQDRSRRLGQPAPVAIPPNWRPGPEAPANLFDGMVAPSEVEIVDRWLEPDGSHNVVINTPTGHTLCGRANAWNPMQPLVEHVMLWRPCGGGGKRSFDLPRREYPAPYRDD